MTTKKLICNVDWFVIVRTNNHLNAARTARYVQLDEYEGKVLFKVQSKKYGTETYGLARDNLRLDLPLDSESDWNNYHHTSDDVKISQTKWQAYDKGISKFSTYLACWSIQVHAENTQEAIYIARDVQRYRFNEVSLFRVQDMRTEEGAYVIDLYGFEPHESDPCNTRNGVDQEDIYIYSKQRMKKVVIKG